MSEREFEDWTYLDLLTTYRRDSDRLARMKTEILRRREVEKAESGRKPASNQESASPAPA